MLQCSRSTQFTLTQFTLHTYLHVADVHVPADELALLDAIPVVNLGLRPAEGRMEGIIIKG